MALVPRHLLRGNRPHIAHVILVHVRTTRELRQYCEQLQNVVLDVIQSALAFIHGPKESLGNGAKQYRHALCQKSALFTIDYQYCRRGLVDIDEDPQDTAEYNARLGKRLKTDKLLRQSTGAPSLPRITF